MKKFSLLCSLFTLHCSLFTLEVTAQVGTWRNYMSYHEPQQIQAAGSEHLFVLASNDLYQYNLTDQSITTYDKVTGLSDSRIRHIAWNAKAGRLIAVYDNANIDLVDLAGNVSNISALYTKSMTADKTVDSLTVDDVYAYLYARFGIVKVNMERAEISDTYTPQHPQYPTKLPPSNKADYAKYITLVSTLSPGGPKYNYFGFMRYANQQLYTVTRTGSQTEFQVCPQVYDGSDNWTIYDDDLKQTIGHRYVGAFSIDVDPTDDTHVIVTTQTGVYEYRNGKFLKEHTNDNSPLETASTVGNNNKDYVLVTGGKFDQNGNFWCLNSISPSNSLLRLKKDGTWQSYPHSELMQYADRSLEEMKGMMFDSRGLLWFVNDFHRTPALLRYDTSTDRVKRYATFTNQDGVNYTLSYVRCVVEDAEHNIWVGTNQGPFYLPAAGAEGDDETFYQFKVPRNDGSDYADYLFTGVDITAMAIDGGGRKWFGTNGNGVYLISADNLTQLQHFTTENSSLLSDNIESICIFEKTGEVFFGTDRGLCSYHSDATTPVETMSKDNIYAYPNPVTPDFTGLITIVGLTMNADVKICTSSGKVVAEGRSNGGTFIWDGADRSGRRVASGVYMVVTATANGKKGTVCKIAVVN